MALKYLLDSIDTLDDKSKTLYKKTDSGKYQLDVEDLPQPDEKQKVKEFRETNVNLMKEIETLKSKVEGIDLEGFNKFIKSQQDVDDQKLIKEGKIDQLVEKRSESMKTKYESEISTLTAKTNKLNETLKSTLIDGQLAKLAATAGIKNTAIDDVILRGKQIFNLDADGNVIAKSGDTIKYNANNKPYTINDFMGDLQSSAPHLFQESNGGGTTNKKSSSNVPGVQQISRADYKNYIAKNPNAINDIVSGKIEVVE